MADSKITALTSISTSADPANDPLVIVDVSDTSMAATGTAKKVTLNQLLGASGTATLASATITGDLTARNWFVSGGSLPGVGNSNPFAYRIGGGGLGIGAATETGTTAPIVFYAGQGGVEQYRIAPLGVNTWSDGAGGTRMTLNATGLGVGISPIYKLHVKSDLSELYFRDNGTASELLIISETGGRSALYFGDVADTVRGGIVYDSATDSLDIRGYNNVARLQIDSVGNVVSNVTATAPTLLINSQMVFNLTSNTNLRISVRGTDGVTRTANLTLA